jgi:hypothetical protein
LARRVPSFEQLDDRRERLDRRRAGRVGTSVPIRMRLVAPAPHAPSVPTIT